MPASFTCIIIDDERHAIGLLTECLKSLYNNISIIGTYTSWKEGIEAVRSHNADLLFLDISIEGKNGMDILKIVPDINSEIIFITAYAEHALAAFKFSPSGYIMKPIGDAELSSAVNKAMERIKNKRLAKQHNHAHMQVNAKIGVPSGKGISYFNLEDIIYFEAVGNYTRVVTNKSEVTSSYNIGKFKNLVEGAPFFPVHRSYIVNINYIVRYEAIGILTMANKAEIPVARNSREEFLKLFTGLQSDID